ncbi:MULTISPECIES: helix-turn-helix domain-containing protein [Xanthobacter]|uniref:helix-turn-helix domain-containing protein n=1 Tax=Xanthobacter TaxID=279 RepID=UPI001F15FCC6|nr:MULTISPECIES: helix-turn-helix domain-containing protein [unclassified Xanthobacter]
MRQIHPPLPDIAAGSLPPSNTSRDALPSRTDPTDRARIVIALVSAASGVAVETLLALRRSQAPVAAARQLAMYLAHVVLGLSQTDVARAFGRDRTTVAHACRRIEDQRDRAAFDRRVAQLEACVRWAAEH